MPLTYEQRSVIASRYPWVLGFDLCDGSTGKPEYCGTSEMDTDPAMVPVVFRLSAGLLVVLETNQRLALLTPSERKRCYACVGLASRPSGMPEDGSNGVLGLWLLGRQLAGK